MLLVVRNAFALIATLMGWTVLEYARVTVVMMNSARIVLRHSTLVMNVIAGSAPSAATLRNAMHVRSTVFNAIVTFAIMTKS